MLALGRVETSKAQRLLRGRVEAEFPGAGVAQSSLLVPA